MLKTFLISTFILLSATIIESSILSNLAFLFVVPDIVLICSVYFSLLNGKVIGQSTGFISGLFLDFISALPLGFNCLIRTIIGYLFGIFSNAVIISGILMPVLSVGIGTILKYLLIQLVTLFFPNISILIVGFFSYEFLFELGINIVLAPLIFKFLSLFKKSLTVITTKDKVDYVQ